MAGLGPCNQPAPWPPLLWETVDTCLYLSPIPHTVGTASLGWIRRELAGRRREEARGSG